jgi:hypothetical protein
MRERGTSRSSPPATGRAKSVPDAAGSHGDTDRRTQQTPQPVLAGQGLFLQVWRVKDSNLGRHQPADLQTVSILDALS